MLMTMLIIQDTSSLSGGGEKRRAGNQPAQFRAHLPQTRNWPYFKLRGL